MGIIGVSDSRIDTDGEGTAEKPYDTEVVNSIANTLNYYAEKIWLDDFLWYLILRKYGEGCNRETPDKKRWIYNPPVWLINDYRSAVNYCNLQGLDPHAVIPSIAGIPISLNLPAIVMIIITTAILVKGTKDSAKMAGIMVAVKLGVIALFVLTGIFYIKPENWTPFAPNGFEGVFMGAFIIFFAYIGFDALATAAEECKNPQKDLPIGILGSLIVTTVVYVLVALVLTGMQPTSGVAIPDGLFKAPMAFAMTAVHQNWIAGLISIGSLAGLTSVLLVMHMAATRVLFAMSRDNFLPRVFQKIHPKFNTPHILTITVGIVGILGTLILDLNVAASLCNFGTFTSFIIVWVVMGILIYTSYGYKKNRLAEAAVAETIAEKEIAEKDEFKAGIK